MKSLEPSRCYLASKRMPIKRERKIRQSRTRRLARVSQKVEDVGGNEEVHGNEEEKRIDKEEEKETIAESNGKRYLTQDEIENLLEFITPNKRLPPETASSVVEKTKNALREQLSTQLIYPQLIPVLKENLEKSYVKSLIEPGESVGVTTGQSIGAPATQMTLNTFHKAGQGEKTVTSGISSFEEYMNATKNPKNTSCKIYFSNPENLNSVRDVRSVIGSNVVELSVGSVAKSIRISYTPPVIEEEEGESGEDRDGGEREESYSFPPWHSIYSLLYNESENGSNPNPPNMESKAIVSITLDLDKLYTYRLHPEMVVQAITREYSQKDIECILSPLNLGEISLLISTDNLTLPEDRILYVDKSNAIEIFLEEVIIENLYTLYICGVSGISEIYYIREEGEWVVETSGGELKDILTIPGVDQTRVITNSAWDIYNTLGIEAVRQFLIEKLGEIMEKVNECHIMLLVDRMTFKGTISSISRYTMRTDESGPMGKASFEETMDNFQNAGAHGDIEPTRGVSASIICGKRAGMGTGCFELRMNLDSLPDTESECDGFEEIENFGGFESRESRERGDDIGEEFVEI